MDKAWHEQPRDDTDKVITKTNKYPKNLLVLSLSLICHLYTQISVSKFRYSENKGRGGR